MIPSASACKIAGITGCQLFLHSQIRKKERGGRGKRGREEGGKGGEKRGRAGGREERREGEGKETKSSGSYMESCPFQFIPLTS